MKTFDFCDMVLKAMGQRGTGSYPIQFRDSTGRTYEPGEVTTVLDDNDKHNGVTVVHLKGV